MFAELLSLIQAAKWCSFGEATDRIDAFIGATNYFVDVLSQIGTIPESIAHDSTEEKLFAKASDIVLSRAFREIGLQSTPLSVRSDAADVLARSTYHGYSLVADAKSFRLSRTAKNQKDFKVSALSKWRRGNEYAVLCAPYFHYPSTQSQIYAQAIEENVCLFSWEHMVFLVENKIAECDDIDFSSIWNLGSVLAHITTIAQRKACFLYDENTQFLKAFHGNRADFDCSMLKYSQNISFRAIVEKEHWEYERKRVMELTRSQAIDELLRLMKIEEKLRQIESFLRRIQRD